MRRFHLVTALSFVAVVACAAPQKSRALVIAGTGTYSHAVTAKDPQAQRWFDQGLMLAYGFNHDEAVRSFEMAASLDPDCAMAYWGQAYALGPNINMPADEARSTAAWEAIQQARAHTAGATPLERDLIAALATRYAMPVPADRKALDQAYANAMAALWRKYPADPDVGFLYADALINLAPWDQWTPDFQPKANTEELLAVLDRVMELDLHHPGANHYYIHALEASGDPGRAEAAADRLAALTPGLGHMVHMPAHIYVQVGRYADSIRANEAGSKLDREYFARAGQQGAYHFYHAHNNHFRVWTAMYMGNYEDALAACRQTLIDLPDALEADPGTAEWLVMDVHVHLRFGNWQAVLDAPSPRADQPYAVAMWHYARGIALANQGRIDAAKAEAKKFEEQVAKVPVDQMVFIISALDVTKVAREMLAGEIAYKAGDVEGAFAHLRQAVANEDALRYSEPSPWLMPTRHSLGALLLDQGRVAEAEKIYREDLRKHNGNVWSLHGLTECLERRGADAAEVKDLRAQLAKAEANSTVPVRASCYCRPAASGDRQASHPQ
jgi:tetratricopeptide (TPR) repeat protein